MSIEDVKYEKISSSINLNNDNFIFYAHPYEILNEHLIKTSNIFNELINDSILKKFHKSFLNENFINLSFEDFKKIINDLVLFHDYGKLSFNFQLNRLNKNYPDIYNKQKKFVEKYFGNSKVIKDFTIKHSLVGSILFLSKYINTDSLNKPFILLLSYIIYGHHTKLKDLYSEVDFAYKIDDSTEITYELLLLYLNIASKEELDTIFPVKSIQDFQKENGEEFIKDDYKFFSSISFFYNYIYSLLVTSDVIASSKSNLSINEVKYQKFSNIINQKLLNHMQNTFYNVSYNKNLNKTVTKIEDINDLRLQMLQEANNNLMKSLKETPDNKVFFLKMPTGGGKTNTSMKLALDIISNTTANRIIYSMPFINIIEQNYDTICNNYGLNEDYSQVRKIYTGTETIFKNKNDEFKSKIILNDQFFNYPVICTTFVSLFNSLLKNNKNNKYMLNSLSNSVIILDEIQSLPLKNWNSLYYLINELSINYNTYFIIMSATLPEFDDLKLDKSSQISYSTCNLINNPMNYFNHHLFDRTKICDIQDLYLKDEENFINYYIEKIKENFKIGYKKGLIVLNTIKSSRKVYELLFEYKNELNFDIDLLNSSLLSTRKNMIINKINNLKNMDSNYILVSTQSIEAGVDVSFDFVFRDFANLDSIEQVRGRCNRSGELYEKFNNINQKGNIYLTNIHDSNNKSYYSYIYDNTEKKTRIKETKNIIKEDYNYNDILKYYKQVSKDINQDNDSNENNLILTDRENIIHWNQLHYAKLMDKKTGIHIIDDSLNQYSIFVETSLPIFNNLKLNGNIEKMEINEIEQLYENNKDYFLFSFNEIKYLKDKNNIILGNNIVGSALLEFYKQELNKFDFKDYTNYKIFKKEFSSILNKFIFNITLNKEELKSEIEDDLELFSYFYIIPKDKIGEEENDLYSINEGFNYNPISTYIQ